jgi:gamma-glutamyltranspeptidase / glutathione hydrolase
LDHYPSAQLNAATDPLNPTGWAADTIRRALLPGELAPDIRTATGDGDRGIVVGSTGAFATLAGQHALMAGGSAVDAALATAFAQIGLCLGAWVSYAGLFSLVHYSAATGEVDTLSAGFGTCMAETDPAGIPSPPTPSGRTALVPGFVAGAYAAHQRFGWLPWKALWSPALHLAERGVPINAAMEGIFNARADTLGRTPEGRAAFAAEGCFPRAGELFRQPALAAALQALAEQGPDWMYRGPWAQHFVDLVRREGGRIQVSDLADYRPRWGEPLNTEFAGHQVLTLPTPDTGGLALLIALALIEAAELGDPARDPDALYWLIQIIENSSAQAGETKVSALDPGRIAALWQEMLHARAATTPDSAERGGHSDFVLTADADGNMAAVCHSINTAIWGTTGIVVDGIPIPDPASFQQPALVRLDPGAHLPMPVNPAIALRNGQPLLASSSIGAGLHAVTVQQLNSVLRLGNDIHAAVDQPLIHAKDVIMDASITAIISQLLGNQPSARAIDNRFDPVLLDAVRARGQQVTPHAIDDPTLSRGYWGGIAHYPGRTPRYHGARTPSGWGPIRGISF